jgi:hypothetical protein
MIWIVPVMDAAAGKPVYRERADFERFPQTVQGLLRLIKASNSGAGRP